MGGKSDAPRCWQAAISPGLKLFRMEFGCVSSHHDERFWTETSRWRMDEL
jgi:hypothetical protein